MTVRNVLWWLGFIVAAIFAQSMIAGTDFLVVGLVISLQEERWPQSLWLGLAFTLLQEGSGSLAFGSSILWYGAVIGLFLIGRWLFEARSIVFIMVLGLGLGAWHYGLIQWMVFLQDLEISPRKLFWESLVQALIFPPAWGLASFLRFRRHDDVLAA